jgi:hypothetical protein
MRPDEINVEKYANLMVTAKVPPGAIPDLARGGKAIEESLYSFRQAAWLYRDARAEYVRHLSQPEEGIRKLQNFASHMDELVADQMMAEADHDFLLALLPDRGEKYPPLVGEPALTDRNALLERAWQKYRTGVTWNRYVNLKYYTPGEIAIPHRSITRDSLATLLDRPQEIDAIYNFVMQQINQRPDLDQNRGNREENQSNEDRALQRMKDIEQMLGKTLSAPPTTIPSFPSTNPGILGPFR